MRENVEFVQKNGFSKSSKKRPIMIELHRPEKSTFCDEIEEEFADLMVRYKPVVYSSPNISDQDLPYIDDGIDRANGEDEIRNYMDQLTKDVKIMGEFTSDACYIDPDTGEVC